MNQFTVGGKEYDAAQVVEHSKKAAGWFGAIAAFSAINSVLVLAGANVSFVIGLGATLIVDGVLLGIREQVDGLALVIITAIGIIINLGFLGTFLLIWWLSRRGFVVAYVVGMIFYLLDGLIFLLFRDIAGIGFHAFFLYMLWAGFGFVKQHKRAQSFLDAGYGEEFVERESEADTLDDDLSSQPGW